MKKSRSSRLREILKVLKQYNVIKNFSKQEHPEEVRQAFEALGATFIKIGQMLSVRTDLLTSEYINELKKLQDNVQQDSFETIKQVVEQELGLPLADIFTNFEEESFASASIGQAHRGELLDGTRVVVKVQHPHIAEDIQLDLSLFEKALPLIRYIPETKVVDLGSVLREVKRSLSKELDFLQEAANGQQFYEKNNGWRAIRSPKIYRELSSRRVIVMEEMPGESLKYLLTSDEQELLPNVSNLELKKSISNLLVASFMKQVFEDGFFHADPHPGNVFLFIDDQETTTPQPFQASFGPVTMAADITLASPADYQLIYLDFGMMGDIDEGMRNKLIQALIALYTKNPHRIGKAVLALCKQEGPFDRDEFYVEMHEFLDSYYDLPIKDLQLQQVFSQMVAICYKNNLQVDQSVVMLAKAFSTLEGVIEELNPELSMMEVAAPYAQKYFLKQLDIGDELRQGSVDLWEALKSAPKLPARLLQALDKLAEGKVSVELKQQQRMNHDLLRAVNRVIAGLFMSAIIIGSAVLLQAYAQTGNVFVQQIALLGYGLVGVMALIWVIIEWRNRFRK